jgi:hypothetical protein
VLVLLLVGGVILIFLSYLSLLGCDSQAARLIQTLSGLAIAATAIIALSGTDPKRRVVSVVISSPYVDEEGIYPKDKMSKELKVYYKDFSDPIRSHQVHFRITNNSNFTLNRPTLTFRIPVEKKHPNKHEREEIWHLRNFNSNLYNSREELRIFECADTSILSNSNLPYWNSGEEVTIWIRMILDDGKLEVFNVEVSVNCENADGVTQKVEINPKRLLKSPDKKNSRNTQS